MSKVHRENLRAAAFIVWVDNGGYEGWRPTIFASSREVIEWIEDGGAHGQSFVVTRGALNLTVGAPPSPAADHGEGNGGGHGAA